MVVVVLAIVAIVKSAWLLVDFRAPTLQSLLQRAKFVECHLKRLYQRPGGKVGELIDDNFVECLLELVFKIVEMQSGSFEPRTS